MSRLPLIYRLALADLMHARVATLCQIVGLAALLVPLLIILGIKNGYIADRTAALLQNPEELRINITGQEGFSAAFVDRLSDNHDVRFVGPHPFQLAVLVDFAVPVNGGAFASRVTVLATGEGDPYLPDEFPVPAPGEAVLSASLAGELGGVSVGDTVEAIMEDQQDASDIAFMTLKVVGVLPAGLWGRSGALMDPHDVFLLQDWTHGDVPGPELDAAREGYALPDRFTLIRLYAADVDGAFRLVEDLAAEGYATGASLMRAESLRALRNALDVGFITVASVGLIGVTVTFAASLWAAISRNRRPISLLRVGGLERTRTVLLPVTQAATIGVLGWLLSILVYTMMTGLLDGLLASTFNVDESLARLTGAELVASAVATLLVSVVASVAAAFAITSITPEEGFLDVR